MAASRPSRVEAPREPLQLGSPKQRQSSTLPVLATKGPIPKIAVCRVIRIRMPQVPAQTLRPIQGCREASSIEGGMDGSGMSAEGDPACPYMRRLREMLAT